MNQPLSDGRIRRGLERQFETRRTGLAAGDGRLGWKVGFGTPEAMARLAIPAPLVGFLSQRASLDPGSELALSTFACAVVEPEIAVHMGADLAGDAGRDATAQAIAGLGPAIEIADLAFPPGDVEEILAANIYQRHVILGPCDRTRAGGDAAGLRARISADDRDLIEITDVLASTGPLVDIVAHVARVVDACGDGLCAGDVIIAGSLIPPMKIEQPSEFRFTLDPIGSLSVRFAGG